MAQSVKQPLKMVMLLIRMRVWVSGCSACDPASWWGAGTPRWHAQPAVPHHRHLVGNVALPVFCCLCKWDPKQVTWRAACYPLLLVFKRRAVSFLLINGFLPMLDTVSEPTKRKFSFPLVCGSLGFLWGLCASFLLFFIYLLFKHLFERQN